MKKWIAGMIAMLLVVSLFASCASGNGGSSGTKDALKDGTKLSDIIDKIDADIGIAMPGDLTKEMLQDTYSIDDTMVEEFSGKVAMITPGVDEVVIVKAKDGQVEKVKEAMEKRKEARVQEQYLPGMIEKAKAARVVVKGNYVALLLLGDEAKEDLTEDAKKAEEIFLSYFN